MPSLKKPIRNPHKISHEEFDNSNFQLLVIKIKHLEHEFARSGHTVLQVDHDYHNCDCFTKLNSRDSQGL